jgi:hypothetical protein
MVQMYTQMASLTFADSRPPFGIEYTKTLTRLSSMFNIRVVSRVFQKEQTRKVWVNLIKSPFQSAARISPPFLLAIPRSIDRGYTLA